ncbi:hypothetical protein ACMXYX_04670 [Neptuniibacter sp. QD72_48]|uniref:hypothetical protein n=1 Tax=Neptuniibacter sp. QD72_48 TaxID=3398214 RepID=UPI0039F63888
MKKITMYGVLPLVSSIFGGGVTFLIYRLWVNYKIYDGEFRFIKGTYRDFTYESETLFFTVVYSFLIIFFFMMVCGFLRKSGKILNKSVAFWVLFPMFFSLLFSTVFSCWAYWDSGDLITWGFYIECIRSGVLAAMCYGYAIYGFLHRDYYERMCFIIGGVYKKLKGYAVG